MRIHRLTLEGYGRFLDRALELAPGLQVIVGPNEQGKSTLRSFIGDILYGQKHAVLDDLYDAAHDLRRPWGDPDRYGGRMVYELDDGHVFEVSRRFDQENAFLRVFDQTRQRDVTDEFNHSRNRESAFAVAHVGLTKEVFLSAATITHMTLDELGDKDALAAIRGKLLSLADSGEETHSSETAQAWLHERIERIGRHDARSRPLPAARERLAALEEEYQAATALREELAEVEQKRRGLIEEERTLRKRRVRLREDLATVERLDRARRLAEAERLAEQIQAATRRCFELGSVRDFPLDHVPEVQRAETALDTALAQLDHLHTERIRLQNELAAERQRLGPDAHGLLKEISDEVEIRLAELETEAARLRDRLEGATAARDAVRERFQDVESDLAELPDFSRLAADPVAWVTELSGSFHAARHARNEERAKRTQIHEEIARRHALLEGPMKVFADNEDFLAMARDYDRQEHLAEDQIAQHTAEVDNLRVDADQYRPHLPAFRNMAILCGLVLVALLGVVQATGNAAVLIPATLVGLCLLWFLGKLTYARDAVRRAERRRNTLVERTEELRSQSIADREAIERMMGEAQCNTLRELEALHDQYRENVRQLEALEQDAREQDDRTLEAEDEVTRLFDAYRRTFSGLGVIFDAEDAIDTVAGVAIARYQEYRDAKRRRMESMRLLEQREADVAALTEQLQTVLQAERDLSLQVRQDLRDSGYMDEVKHDSALRALRSYRIRSAQVREKRSRVSMRADNLAGLERQIAHEEGEAARHEATLSRCLKAAGVDSTEAWAERAEQAREYREHWERRTALEEQLDTLLRGQDIETLRLQVESEGPAYGGPERDLQGLEDEVQGITDRIETLQKEEHALHIIMAERAGAARSLNEIDEDRAALRRRVELLDFELRAAGYAMARIDEVAADKHSRIAPRLAASASAFLGEITDQAYEELTVDRELHLHVRIPQTQRLNGDIEQSLSKGTVDQIYLALRLAMVGLLSENRESVPMLLDDPFANYDDLRLERTMALLARLADRHQILLFTCRQDVVRAAAQVDAPIIEL